MFYQIDDLRVAVETAKRLLMKEQIDKQKRGQSSASPFLKVSQENSKKSEKGVAFGAMETIKRHRDSIDKLTSLMNKLDMKLDRRKSSIGQKFSQGRNRGCGQRQDRYRSRDRSYSKERGQYNNNNKQRRGNYNSNYHDRNYRSNYRKIVGLEIGATMEMVIEGTIDMTVGPNYRRDNFRQNYGYRNRSVSRERDMSRPRYRSNSRDNSRNRYNRDQSRRRDRGQRSRTVSRIEKIDKDLDQVPVLAQTGIGPGVIDAMNMIMLLGNALML